MAEIQRDIEPQSSLGKLESTRIVNNADENDADMGPSVTNELKRAALNVYLRKIQGLRKFKDFCLNYQMEQFFCLNRASI